MRIIRHPRHADKVMRAEGTLAVAGVCGGTILWAEARTFHGYGFAAAAFVALTGVQSGIRALRTYNRYARGTEGEQCVVTALQMLDNSYTCVTSFVVPGTRQGDTDLIILGPFGIVVVEVKAYAGPHACHGDTWYQVRADGEKVPLRSSVSRQAKRNRKAVQHYLLDFEVETPVYAVVVFQSTARLQLYRPTVPVLGPDTLAEYLQQLPCTLPPPDMTLLHQLFSPKAAQPAAAVPDMLMGRTHA